MRDTNPRFMRLRSQLDQGPPAAALWRRLFLYACLLGLLAAAPASAHFAAFPIAADSVSILTQGASSNWQFSYSTTGQEALIIGHDLSLIHI